LDYCLHAESCVLILTIKWVGPHFGRCFHKLIWPPYRLHNTIPTYSVYKMKHFLKEANR
jgi:hypothetical protein